MLVVSHRGMTSQMLSFLPISNTASDVAYFLISCALPEYLETEEQENELLRVYFTERESNHRGKDRMNFMQFRKIFDVAFLDFMRWLIGYGLWGGPLEQWCLGRADDLLARADGHGIAPEETYERVF